MDFSSFTNRDSGYRTGLLTVDSEVVSLTRVVKPAPEPFAWQNGNQLLLMDVDQGGWQFAELVFVPGECRYIELRRSTYEWPREAVGALLSRALASGDSALIDTVEQFHDYLSRHFNISILNC